jgi:hypothetical protein
MQTKFASFWVKITSLTLGLQKIKKETNENVARAILE